MGNKRIKARQYNGGQLVRTTWYADNFERVVEGSTEKFYHWIQSPDGPVALVIKVTGGATTIYYLCTDHLNSITGIMDASGNMQEEYSYDPWGRRRSPVNWSTDTLTAPVITARGYTGHEHLDAFGLIHMNGRIYDPHLARVLNPDPIIQDPTDIQNYNRYSYCLNNPLKYTDPSGYGLKKLFRRLFGLDDCKTPTGRTQKAKETEHADFYNWLQGVGSGGSSHGSGGSISNSDMSGGFTYIPGISTYNPVPYTSSFSGYAGGSGNSSEYTPWSSGSIQKQVSIVPSTSSNAYKPGKDGESGTLSDFVKRYSGKTFEEIVAENGKANYDYPNGPILNYVEDPLSPGKYIDMTHFLIVGRKGPLHGMALEINQIGSPSAFKRQDLWSNALGYAFWTDYEWKVMNNPNRFIEYIDIFLRNRYYLWK